MRRRITEKQIGFWVAQVFVLVLLAPFTGAQDPSTTPEVEYPIILSPEDEARLPSNDEASTCSEHGPCYRYRVKGRVPSGPWPFLAVAPLNAAPKIWIQRPITNVRRNGVFEGIVFLGNAEVGAGEWYNIFILTHPDKERFRQGEVLMKLPDDCEESDPVTVFRER